MAITQSREANVELRYFGMADEYPKDLRAAVTELRRRGYDAFGRRMADRLRQAADDGGLPRLDRQERSPRSLTETREETETTKISRQDSGKRQEDRRAGLF
jgi:hypothetical protein